MGIWERLGNVIKSYLNDNDDSSTRYGGNSSSDREWNTRDNDLDAAYEELDEFLRGGGAPREEGRGTGTGAAEHVRPVPEELRADFAELGLGPGASAKECKDTYKKLLKMYHPDRHAGNAEAVKIATEKTARVNTAYDRLEKWFRDTGTSI